MEITRNTIKLIAYPALMLAVLMHSCKKDNLQSTSEPVVQGYLMPDSAITVRLYAQKSLTDTAKFGAPITGLTLTVSNGISTETLTESTTKGVYTNPDRGFVTEGKTYTLSFAYQSAIISAKTAMPGKPVGFATQYINVTYTPSGTPIGTPDTLNTFTWQNPDSLNHVLVFDNTDGRSFPLSTFSRGNFDFEVDTKRLSAYYALPQIFPFYGHYKVVLLRVNQEYIDLLKSNASGANSQSLLNTPTNVVNGFGIFTAMQSDTLNFNLL